jgi:S-DNA-T family DNA segregation ATPase FtsK/SpoIIIE
LTYNEIEPVTIDLAHVGVVGIYGRDGFGKSNLVRLVMEYLQKRVFDLSCNAYLIDGYDRQLAEFESYGFVEGLSIDCADFEDIVQRFTDAADARMGILRDGGNLNDEPLLLCVVQNPRIFAADAVSRTASDQFKSLMAEAKQLKICFILSNVDNNGEYTVPDMMKYAREFSPFFLLDDLANVKLFGSGKFNATDLRDYKKPIAIGDGYICDARGGLEKVKLVKCDRR